ncbi:MAG: RNA methyltransferase [Candidatus Micrarchaeota archaeon]|nr:RNA methyltransferase [Candidatus Micrarchaeota archaeon]
MTTQNGFVGIGIENGKTLPNLGTLWRSAEILGASFIFTTGRRYNKQSSDVLKSWRRIPLYTYEDFTDLYNHLPYNCHLVGAELDERAVPLETFDHPARCVYLLGAEDSGLTKMARARCHKLVQLPGKHSLNVASCGTVILYDRISKRGK